MEKSKKKKLISQPGYYADEDAGCQVFHVCDDGLVSSFLCPVGSLFSQRLLTCDWWGKVPCAQSHEFYASQSYSAVDELNVEDMLRQALTETGDYRQAKDDDKPILVSVRRNENQLDQGDKRGRGRQRNRFHEEEEVKEVTDSPVTRIKTLVEDRRTRFRGYSRYGG